MFSFWALLVLVLALLWILATTGTEILESSTSKFGACTLPSYGFPGSAFACAEWDDEKRRRNQPSPGSLGEHKSPDRPREYMKMPSTVRELGTIEPIHIVCIGHCRPHHFISDEILDIPGFKVSMERDHTKLHSTFHGIPALILIYDSFPPRELENACRFIRHQWPHTRILVIHDGEDFLEDSLYEDRVRTDVTGQDLIRRILFLIQTIDLWRLRGVKR